MHLLKFVNKVAESGDADMIATIRSVLYKDYIKTVVEESDGNGFRMIFIGDRMKGNFNNPLTKECNGAVLYFDNVSFKPLAVPPHVFNSSRMNIKMIENKFKSSNYKCYPVLDGTIANLYFFKGEWKISTSKAYDASAIVMVNGKTFKDVFFESGGSFEDLDKDFCYTVCIKDEKFHVFQPGSSVTFIQRVNLKTLEKEIFQEEIEIGWKSLKVKLNNAIEMFKSKKTTFLGVILRSNEESILLESNLMIKLRNFLYNFTVSKKMNIEHDMIYLNVIKVFLSRKDVSLYLSLFPFYKKEMSRLNKILEENATALCEGNLYNDFCKKVKSDLEFKKIELTKADGLKIAYDFMRSPAYINEFYKLATS